MPGVFSKISMLAIETMDIAGCMYSNALPWKAEGISITKSKNERAAFDEHFIDDKLNETAG